MVKPTAQKRRQSQICKLMPFVNEIVLSFCYCSDEKDDTLSAISGGSLKPETASGQPATSHATLTTPTLTASSMIVNSVPTATPEVDEEEYSIRPPMDSWDKNGSPQKSEF